jgi:hypothetical protein
MSLTFDERNCDIIRDRRRSCPSEEDSVRAYGKSGPALVPQALPARNYRAILSAPARNIAGATPVSATAVMEPRFFACTTTSAFHRSPLFRAKVAPVRSSVTKDFDHDIQA